VPRPTKDDPPRELPNPHIYVEIDQAARARGLRLTARGDLWALVPVGADKHEADPVVSSMRLKDLEAWLFNA
jgi:hypothetical protein